MNNLTFGVALLSLFVTLAAALVHEVFFAPSTPAAQPTLVARQAPRALATPVDCPQVAQAATTR